MSETKQYHLSDVLTITTGLLVSERHVDAIYDILGWMTGEQLYTHQLPRAWRECAPVLCAHFPSLPVESDITVDLRIDEVRAAWLAEQVARFGEHLEVPRLPAREPQYDTPIADAIEMVGDPTKVIVHEVEL